MRAIIAASEPAEELVLANMHLVQLTATPRPGKAPVTASESAPASPPGAPELGSDGVRELAAGETGGGGSHPQRVRRSNSASSLRERGRG